MSGNSSSVDAMDDMIKMLTGFQEKQQEMGNQLKREYDIVGSEWDDAQYKNLENVMCDIYTTLNASYVQVSECITKIQLLKRALEEYLRVRI
ncbi:hypothetical protein [Faecalicatena orotica]|uniref:hypothetical protein n=1 Tax=Faecalicatena orotica TaxID=1544 RepID=UPI0032162D01